MKAERDEAVAGMAQLTPRLEAKSKELMVATAAAKAAAAEVEALEGERSARGNAEAHSKDSQQTGV